MSHPLLTSLASELVLDALLRRLEPWQPELCAHWQQGDFHHDHVWRLASPPTDLPGPVLVISTNCNGGVKEVCCLAEVPDRWGLWHVRCPENPEFDASRAPRVLAAARTCHWFPEHELLRDDAISEYRAEHRERQRGGGWRPRGTGDDV